MAVKKSVTKAKKTTTSRKTAKKSPPAKKAIGRSSPKTAVKKDVQPPVKKTAPAQPLAPPREGVVHAAKKVLDDISIRGNFARTKKTTKELAHQLYSRAEHIVKGAASASSKTAGKARKASRDAAYNFVKSAIGFLETVEHKIDSKPTGTKKKAAPANKKKTAVKKKAAAKKKTVRKSTGRAVGK